MLATPLKTQYGVQVHDCQLAEVSQTTDYRWLLDAFETHSLLYFADQTMDDDAHIRLSALFGPLEDRSLSEDRALPKVSTLSNVKKDQQVCEEGNKQLLNLQANMLWHTDSTFLPVPALANILVGRVIPPSGSTTEFASTRVAWAEMPEQLKNRVEGLHFRHNFAHSRRQIDVDFAQDETFTHWAEQAWKSTWRNPHNGSDALYIASHVCGIVGMADTQATALVEELVEWCTHPQYVYTHVWREGDVLIWDERATIHRGRPWNYTEKRTLSSICVSAGESDGLDSVRYKQFR